MRGLVWFFLSILLLTLLEGWNAPRQHSEVTDKPPAATKHGWPQ